MKLLLLYFAIGVSLLTATEPTKLKELLPINVGYGIENVQLLRAPDIKNLNELPDDIQHKIFEHLTSKIGKDNFDRLVFSGLWYIDEEKLIEKTHQGRRIEEKIYRYHIEYKIALEEFGITKLKTFIRLKENLDVQRDIGLPPKANWNFASIESIWPKALRKLKERDYYDLDFVYDEENDRMNWVVRSITRLGLSGSGEQAVFDGISGDLITIQSYGFDGF